MVITKKSIRLAAVFLLLLLQIFACSSMPDVTVEALPQYEAFFSGNDGWTGGDGAYSVALNEHKVIWFFGDTWIGQIKNNRHVNATLVNNSVAIQHGRSPAEAEIEFHFGRTDDGRPAALLQPDDGRGWFWIFDGVMLDKRLYVFLIQVERTAGDAVFDFNVMGAWLGQVDNPQDRPVQWQVRQFKIPWVEFSVSRGILWGSAVIPFNNFLYIYGTIEDRQNAVPRKHMILARVPISMPADFSQWRFYADGNWVPDFRRASRLCENVPHEYSVSYLPALKQFALVYSQDGLSKNIMARLSPEPQGPWNDPIPLYQCPEADWDDSIFCYAAKAHAILSEAPNELVLTYIANSIDFNTMADDARLYRPRFLRVTFKKSESRQRRDYK
jgi:hypothetical protein